jgi:NitT/TauT family transport system permease protein
LTPNRNELLALVPSIVFAAVLVAGWQVVVVAFRLPPILLPSPVQVLQAAISESGILLHGLWVTGFAALCGFFMSVVVGTIVAAVMSQAKLIRLALYPYVILLQTVPIVAIAPLLVIWSGYEFRTVVLVTLIISLFPIINSVTEGLMAIPQDRVDLFRLYGASKWQTLWRLRVPTAVKYLMLGCKTSCGLAVIGAIVAEFFVGNGGANYAGLGTLMTGWQTLGRTAPLMAALFASTLLGIAMFATVHIVSNRVVGRWMTNE